MGKESFSLDSAKGLKVLLICNNAFVKGNGLCTAVQSLLQRLNSAGLDARLMAAVNADQGGIQPDFPLEHFKFPFFEPIIYANGFRYAKYSKKRMTEAIEWADVVHIQEAFPLEIHAADIARKMGKPVVGTFHLYAENITANLGIGRWYFVSNIVLKAWRDLVYNKCSIIQCPTDSVREHLIRNGFKSELRTISNGIDVRENVCINNSENSPIKILCTGRLSSEKSQKTLLKAMKYSRYADQIELVFAGNGPYLKKYQRIAAKLEKDGTVRKKIVFGFYNREELRNLCHEAYLYIHCAWVEVEGLSCIEAISEGCVPVIAKGLLSAASQFALDERSIFPVFDSKVLAEKIDWWIEHRQEHDNMKAVYAESAKKYDQKKCTEKIVKLYLDALGK